MVGLRKKAVTMTIVGRDGGRRDAVMVDVVSLQMKVARFWF